MNRNTCTVCKIEKDRTEFSSRNGKKGIQSACKSCRRLAYGTGDDSKKYWLKAKYNMELADYYNLLKRQNDKCAICETPSHTINHYGPMALAVDHCHVTKKVRGLLCVACNTSIGKFKDDIDLLCKAVIYLNRTNKQGA